MSLWIFVSNGPETIREYPIRGLHGPYSEKEAGKCLVSLLSIAKDQALTCNLINAETKESALEQGWKLSPPVKNPLWKQETPQDQLITLLMALEGNLSNAENNVISPSVFNRRCRESLDHLQQLRPFFTPGVSW